MNNGKEEVFKQVLGPSEALLRYKLNAEKVRLYQAILDIDYRKLTDNEVELGFLLAKDDFIQGIIQQAINEQRTPLPPREGGNSD